MLGIGGLERERARHFGETNSDFMGRGCAVPSFVPGLLPLPTSSLRCTRCTCFSHAACPSRPRVPCWHVPSHFQEQPMTLLTSSSTISFPSPLGQTVKEESLPLPAANPLVTPQKPGIALDNSLHKDLFGAISGIGNVSCSVCFSLVSFWKRLHPAVWERATPTFKLEP